MNLDSKTPQDQSSIDAQASDWVLRQDRGLSASEQDTLSLWLAADVRHREALRACRWGWEELDRLAGLQSTVPGVPNPDLLERKSAPVPHRTNWRKHVLSLAAILTVVGLGAWATSRYQSTPSVPMSGTLASLPSELAPLCEQRVLDDGSVVELNRTAAIEVDFTPAFRRVRLLRGEAHFTVAKNADRPFIVTAGGVETRAVGTAFNVKLDTEHIKVLVTEGKVRVGTAAPIETTTQQATAAEDAPLVAAGQQAVIKRDTTNGQISPTVLTLTPEQIAAQLAWQPRLLDFSDSNLSEIVSAFNRHNSLQLVLADPSLKLLKLSATFRSDNVAGFIRLMEADFGIRIERQTPSEVLLRRAR